MTTESAAVEPAAPPAGLKKGAIGIVAVIFIAIGLAYAVWMRVAKPEAYAEIGRTVMEDTHERSDEPV